jgi:hypothetical protein
MKTEACQRHCDSCDRITRHERNVSAPNHVLHLILSLLTAGLWLFVWLFFVVFQNKGRWVCGQCGQVEESRSSIDGEFVLWIVGGAVLGVLAAFLATR